MNKKLKGGVPLYGKLKIRKDEIMILYPSIKKARNLLGWSPKTNFNIGVEKTVRYFKKLIKN